MLTCYKYLKVLLYFLSCLNSASYADPVGGSNADSIAMRVRQLYQNDLPSMYQRGECAEGDLQQRSGGDGNGGDGNGGDGNGGDGNGGDGNGGDGNGGGFINSPFGFLTTMLILISIFVLLN